MLKDIRVEIQWIVALIGVKNQRIQQREKKKNGIAIAQHTVTDFRHGIGGIRRYIYSELSLSVAIDLLPDHRPHDVDADDVLESVVVQRIRPRTATLFQNSST
ncbi:hypothetical protein T02_5038 [Trichinella nativa]|uniref:Uncharacterized protein n=1 Tax=Trichinella nativa TaxID=6335 RepID=A0A0V1LEG1_9BILA|nr:hypothetical protein T02_5038 [Trichinella nativa]